MSKETVSMDEHLREALAHMEGCSDEQLRDFLMLLTCEWVRRERITCRDEGVTDNKTILVGAISHAFGAYVSALVNESSIDMVEEIAKMMFVGDAFWNALRANEAKRPS